MTDAGFTISTSGALALIIAALIFGGLFVWWLLITTEGVYLGRRVVIWLYDVYARRYDRIKQYDAGWEAATLVAARLIWTARFQWLRHRPGL